MPLYVQKQCVEINGVCREVDMGLSVERHPLFELVFDEFVQFFLGFSGKEGACLPGMLVAFDYSLDADVQEDGETVRVNPVHVVGVARGAAAGADDDVVRLFGSVQDNLFQLPECRFAVPAEEEGDGGAVMAFEKLVEVGKLVSETLCQLSPHGAFPAVHVAYKVYSHAPCCPMGCVGSVVGFAGGCLAGSV